MICVFAYDSMPELYLQYLPAISLLYHRIIFMLWLVVAGVLSYVVVFIRFASFTFSIELLNNHILCINL